MRKRLVILKMRLSPSGFPKVYWLGKLCALKDTVIIKTGTSKLSCVYVTLRSYISIDISLNSSRAFKPSIFMCNHNYQLLMTALRDRSPNIDKTKKFYVLICKNISEYLISSTHSFNTAGST